MPPTSRENAGRGDEKYFYISEVRILLVWEINGKLCSTNLFPSNWRTVQRSQNASVTTISVGHVMAGEDHLHQEVNILPMKERTKMSEMIQANTTSGNRYSKTVSHLPRPTSQRRLNRGTKLIYTYT